jgi:acylphosphatase
LAITGWVKNLPNGDVELEVEGSRESLENLIAHLRLGPRFAYVTNAEVSWTQHRGRFNRFEIR